jgi:hypothetical protein
MAASKLSIAQLDFDGIKQNLIQFLSSQSTFSDYNFTGSALSVLLDVLAYNTHYLGYYLNMVANEMFLDSASLRESVVSLAKQLGYTPTSQTAATAVINFTITPPTNVIPPPPAVLVMPINTSFTTSVGGVNYSFITTETYNLNLNTNNNTYTLNGLTIKEGLPFTLTLLVDTSISNQTFVIPNPNVDTSTITVRVQNSTVDTTITVFSPAGDFNEIKGNDNVYFLQEVSNGQYQVYFGDGIVGSALQNGNLVIISYIACNADAPNFASTFTASQPIGGYSNIQITTVSPAGGGAQRESIESVRFHAPLNYQAQDRAVTTQDYATILTKGYPNINSLSIWGGEDNVPPVYGQVFISLQPAVGFTITETAKQAIINNILESNNVLTVTPVIVDPAYIFLNITCLVKYNPSLTTLSSNAVQAEVINTISNFSSADISSFNTTFYFSNLVSQIDLTDSSIVSNVTSIQMQIRIVPTLNLIQSVTINFNQNNPILPNTIYSSNFVSAPLGFAYLSGDIHRFQDDGNGNINIAKQSGANWVVVKASAGTVDYSKGLITITALDPVSIANNVNYIQIFCTPQSPDVAPITNNIITIDPNGVNVTMEAVSS